MDKNTRPHITLKEDGPFDTHAFNSLAIGGHIAGFHAGNKWLFIYAEDKALIESSGAYESLCRLGWTFHSVGVEKP